MKLSLIIPIYNAESFLPRLFENLEAQGVFFDDKEIGEAIFVNDGSCDRSEELIREYASKHSWVRLLSQPNQGQTVARNTGIQNATGDYIAFQDQDDPYTPQALQHLLHIGGQTDADVVRGEAKWPQENEYYSWKGYKIDKYKKNYAARSGVEFIRHTNGLCYTTMVWATVYRRSFIVDNNLYFNPLVSFYEDAAYNWLIMPVARKVVTIDDIVYLWVQRNASDSHNSDMEHRIRREAHAEQSAVFYRNLWLKYKDKDDFPKDILQMMQRNGWWSCYKYLGTMVRLRGLRREEIKPTIKRLKDEGIYPYPHAYPRMPEGYPQSLPYKLMWRMMSHECLLKLMLRLRTREG